MILILCRIQLFVICVDNSTVVHFGNISLHHVAVCIQLALANAGRRFARYATLAIVVLLCIRAFLCSLGFIIY